MPKERRLIPVGCDSMIFDINARIDLLHQRQAQLVTRMDDLERSTKERLEQFAARLDRDLVGLLDQQKHLLRMATEQEEESARIFANQNDFLVSLQQILEEIHERIQQLSERQDATLRRVALVASRE